MNAGGSCRWGCTSRLSKLYVHDVEQQVKKKRKKSKRDILVIVRRRPWGKFASFQLCAGGGRRWREGVEKGIHSDPGMSDARGAGMNIQKGGNN